MGEGKGEEVRKIMEHKIGLVEGSRYGEHGNGNFLV
jgi:hypothetical protein